MLHLQAGRCRSDDETLQRLQLLLQYRIRAAYGIVNDDDNTVRFLATHRLRWNSQSSHHYLIVVNHATNNYKHGHASGKGKSCQLSLHVHIASAFISGTRVCGACRRCRREALWGMQRPVRAAGALAAWRLRGRARLAPP